MADSDPNERCALVVDSRHVEFLKRYFATLRAVCLQALEDPERSKDPVRDRANAERCRRWLAELDSGVISGSTSELAAEISDCLAEVDQSNDYERAVAEHEAFAHLLRQIPA
jgi:hypothetical protein